MMKKTIVFVLMTMLLVGCSTQSKTTNDKQQSVSMDAHKTLIIYFTRAQNIPLSEGVDTTSSASLIKRGDKIVGNTGYVAEVIQEETGGMLVPLIMSEQYSADYKELETLARQQGQQDVRPLVNTKIENLEDYDTIFLGYPNWWYDMPMPMYTFLEQNDLSNKTIIPFVTHGGSKFSNTIETLKTMYPKATVSEEFEIYQHDIENHDQVIKDWIQGIKK